MDEKNEILQRLARVETKLDMMLEERNIATSALKIANEADQRARSAHHRIDRLDKIVFWAGTTVIGAIILAAIAFLVRGGLSS